MKVIYTLAIVSAIIFSCSTNSTDPNPVQSHDENEIMTMLHDMQKEIDALKLYVNHGEDFARIMQVHNKWAIAMGHKVFEKGNDQTITAIAQAMIERKYAELPKIQDYLNNHTPLWDEKGVIFDAEAKAALQLMHDNADKETLTGDADHDYAVIIRHLHQSTITMAESYLRLGLNTNLRAVAQKMIADEKSDINRLNTWLERSQNQ